MNESEYELLEQKWKSFRKSKRTKLLIPALTLIAVFGALAYLSTLRSHKIASVVSKETNTSVSTASADSNTDKQSSAGRQESAALAPHVPSLAHKESNATGAHGSAKKDTASGMTIVMGGEQSDAASAASQRPNKIELDVVASGNMDVARQVRNRFEVTHDFDDALYLAKYYYARKNYQQSEYWAMQANTINSENEETWILFAKSKVKLGHRVSALKVLQAYFDQTGSQRIKLLLDKIRRGKPIE